MRLIPLVAIESIAAVTGGGPQIRPFDVFVSLYAPSVSSVTLHVDELFRILLVLGAASVTIIIAAQIQNSYNDIVAAFSQAEIV